MTRRSWRDILPVHPAADVFPMMTEEELRELGQDIKKNGLKQRVVLWSDSVVWWDDDDHEDSETGVAPEKLQQYVLDGRNRLAAMELVGMSTVDGDRLRWTQSSSRTIIEATVEDGIVELEESPGRLPDPVAYVISANIKRRHLTKKQQAALILKVITATNDFAKSARSFSPTPGSKGGSTKDPLKQQFIEATGKHGISKRTAEQSLADAKPKSNRVFVTCPECSQSIAESALSKHLEVKHKVKAKQQLLEDAWRDWLNAINKVLMDGAKLAARTEEEGDANLDVYGQSAYQIYQRITERKLAAEIREFQEKAGGLG